MSWVVVSLAAANATKSILDARANQKRADSHDAFRREVIRNSPWTDMKDPGGWAGGNTDVFGGAIGGGLQGAMVGSLIKNMGGFGGGEAAAGSGSAAGTAGAGSGSAAGTAGAAAAGANMAAGQTAGAAAGATPTITPARVSSSPTINAYYGKNPNTFVPPQGPWDPNGGELINHSTWQNAPGTRYVHPESRFFNPWISPY